MKRIMLGLLVLLPGVVGCGPKEGTVSGRVLFEGAPLPAGRVTFRPADGRHNSVSVEIDEQGNYQATLPAGEVEVTVDNREWEPTPSLGGGVLPPGISDEAKKAIGGGAPEKLARPSAPNPSGKYVKIPERYHELESADLGFTVQGGVQQHDIVLKK